jgi:NADH-quinone oxidoreductase subunit D
LSNTTFRSNIAFYLHDPDTVLPFQVELADNRVKYIQFAQSHLLKNVQIVTECNPKQAAIPYPDKFQSLYLFDVHLTQILAIESHYRCSVPDYARYIRILLLELARLLNHYNTFVTLGKNLLFAKWQNQAARDRRQIQSLFHMITRKQRGDSFVTVGGISSDIPVGFIEILQKVLRDLEKGIRYYEKKLTTTNIFTDLLCNIGTISHKTAIAYRLTGPNLRASVKNSKWSYLPQNTLYKDIEFPSLHTDFKKGTAGDSWHRCWLRFLEIEAAIRIIRQVVKKVMSTEVVIQNIPNIDHRDTAFAYQFEGVEGIIHCNIVKNTADYCLIGSHQLAVQNIVSCLHEIIKDQRISALAAILSSVNLNPVHYLLP